MKSSPSDNTFPPTYAPVTPIATPEPELTRNPLNQDPGRYLVRCRRKRSNEEDVVAAHLVKDLDARKHLEVAKVTHIGTSITEEYLHIVFDYRDPGQIITTINAHKGKEMKRIFVSPEMTTCTKRRVVTWIRLHKTRDIGFPIRDEVLQYLYAN